MILKQYFLTKYGGLKLYNDNGTINTIDVDIMYQLKGKGNKELCLCGLLPTYDPKANEDGCECWALKPDEDGTQRIYDAIIEYYEANLDPYIEIIKENIISSILIHLLVQSLFPKYDFIQNIE